MVWLFLETQLLDNYILLKDDKVTTLEEIAPQMADLPIWQLHPHGLSSTLYKMKGIVSSTE